MSFLLNKTKDIWIALFISLFAFAMLGFLPRLNIYNFSWLLEGDLSQSTVGFLSYYSEKFHADLLHTTKILHPYGTSLVLTDSVPIVSLFFKLILKPFLAPPIQIYGIWLFICYFLQSFFSLKIFSQLKLPLINSIIGALLITISSPLILRSNAHIGLCAHFLILWTFYLYLLIIENKPRPFFTYINLFLIQAISIGTHPYLFAMTFTLSGACVFAFEAPFKKRILSLVRILLHFSYTVLLLYLFGYFTETKIGITDTFGRFSSDLLAFFNTGGYSYFFPKIRQGGGQYEGNAYLGLGGMLLFIHSLYIIKKTKIFKKNSLTLMYPILLSLTVLWIYALSKHISFAGHTFLKLDTFYQMIEPIPSILRSSGRMIWPVFYFIFIFIIWIHSKYLFKKTSAAFLLIIFVIQVSEFRPYFFPWKIKLEPQTKMLLDNSAWKGTLASKKNLILIPPTLSGQTCSCTSSNLFTTNEMLIFAHLTSTFGLSLNSGFLGRPFKNRTEYCDSFCRHFATNEIDKDDVYVFRNTMDLSRIDAFQKNTLCLDLDGYTVCSKR